MYSEIDAISFLLFQTNRPLFHHRFINSPHRSAQNLKKFAQSCKDEISNLATLRIPLSR
ncbi:hypothetical protein [Rubritalea tangerina]|uniref:hypothetical protein n=1 Tax=Rubritalea tangerina TaxID=430798 RepID=UPI0036146009